MKIFEIFLIFVQNIDCEFTLELHDLCFRAKIRKNVYPCKPQFSYIKVECNGVYNHGHVCIMAAIQQLAIRL